MAGAGDIADCETTTDEATADLLERLAPDIVITTGDNVYPTGTLERLRECFEPSWGRFRQRIRPAMGNHDDESGFLSYFGVPSSWYHFEAGEWTVVVLDSTRDAAEQGAYLRSVAHGRCSMAIWHHPYLISRREQGLNRARLPMWEAAVAAGVDVVLNGHHHAYERFLVDGVRQFTVGTGGAEPDSFAIQHPDWEYADNTHHGVISLRLSPDSYAWAFVTTAGDTLDQGSAVCR